MSVLLILTLLVGARPDRPDLGGRVVNQDGEPLRADIGERPRTIPACNDAVFRKKY